MGVRIGFDVRAEATGPRTANLYIYGSIVQWKWDPEDDDVTAGEVRKQLEQLGDLDQLDVYINSPGGYVDQATAICSQLDRLQARKVGHIDALAASAASYIAMHMDELAMHRDAWIMIHEPQGWVAGTARDLRKNAELLDRMTGQYARTYAQRTKLDESVILSMMEEERWMDAAEALDLGFIDRIDGQEAQDAAALGAWGDMVALCNWKHAPEAVLRRWGKGEDPRADAEQKQEGDWMDFSALTLEELMAERPDLVDALVMEAEAGVDEKVAAAVARERERLNAIDAVYSYGHSDLVAQAKAEPETTAEMLALRILRAQEARDCEAGQAAFEARKADAKGLGGLGTGDPGKLPGADLGQERAKEAKRLAELMDGKR